MKQKQAYILIIGIFVCLNLAQKGHGFAQDTLNQWVEQQLDSPDDTNKVYLTAHRSLMLSNRENNEASLIAAFLNLARYHDLYGQIDSSIHYFRMLKSAYARGLNHEAVAETCLELNKLYCAKAEYSKALEQVYDALEFYDGNDDKLGVARCYSYIGDLLYYEDKYEESVEYCDKAIAIQLELGAYKDLAVSYRYKASSLLFVEGQLEYALETVNKSISTYKDLGETGLPLMGAINGRGNILKYMKRYDEAIADYESLYEKCMALGLENYTIAPMANIGHVYLIQEKWEQAIPYMEKAIELMKKTGNTKNLWENYFHLANIYKNLGDYKNAYEYRVLEAEENEKYYKTIIERLESEALIKYETAKKDDQLLAQKETIASQRKIQLLYVSIAGLLVLSLMGMLLSRRKIRKKQHELLKSRGELQQSLDNLQATQNQLIHAEKMASLGELTAGIAHEIQNPLNFVNNFSDVSVDMMEEMTEELTDGNISEANTISLDIKQNLEKIKHHGQRASSIVKNMLDHSRSGNGEKQLTNVNTMADEYLRLAYHGLRAKDKSFQSGYHADLDDNLPGVHIVPQDISRVLLNLINNAFYAVSAASEKADSDYKPMVIVSTKNLSNEVEIRVKDNGPGIPTDVLNKIFQPFFTTKPTGEGTGLGLSLSYDIITKGHGGELLVETQEGKGTAFIIRLPIA